MNAPIPADIRTLLIEMPSWVGDTAMATPVLRLAREACPNARIVGLMRPGLDQLLAGLPWLDGIEAVNPRGIGGVLRTRRIYREIQPDASLLLPNSFRSALAAALGRVPIRVGYRRDGRGALLTHAFDPGSRPRPWSTIQHYLELASYAFGRTVSDPELHLCVTPEEAVAAERILKDVPTPFILLNPGGNRVDKRWPADRFSQLAESIIHELGHGVVLNGAPAESGLLEQIASQCSAPVIRLSERGLNLGSLKAVIAQATLVITNDTGPRHLAAALDRPLISLFGPTDHRWTILEGTRERRLLAEPFLEASLVADDHPASCAIERIPLSDVMHAVRATLDQSAD